MQKGSEPVRRQSFSAPLLALRRGDQLLLTEGSALARYLEAQDLARRLGKPLWQVDLAAVTSRYIGATERNLRRLFEAAERAGAILFFDEADALFGKRTEVKDAHDRYAAQLARILLQGIEAFSGPVILAGADPTAGRRLCRRRRWRLASLAAHDGDRQPVGARRLPQQGTAAL